MKNSLATKLLGALPFSSILTLEILVLSASLIHDLIINAAGEAKKSQSGQAEENALD